MKIIRNFLTLLCLSIQGGVWGWFFMFALSAVAQPRPEYPRPQFERADWLNLNGTWSYAFDFSNTGSQKDWAKSQGFEGKILVPFCPESQLSGVKFTDFIPCIWYQRTISVPANWEGKRVLLRFGAVDYETSIYIDGKFVETHFGAGSSFAVDITPYAQPGKTANLVLCVRDDLRSGLQPAGKQCERLNSYGCMYTRTTGIWQTVWMEPVAANALKTVFTIPSP